jgi:hypothetical protein
MMGSLLCHLLCARQGFLILRRRAHAAAAAAADGDDA